MVVEDLNLERLRTNPESRQPERDSNPELLDCDLTRSPLLPLIIDFYQILNSLMILMLHYTVYVNTNTHIYTLLYLLLQGEMLKNTSRKYKKNWHI